MPLFCQSVMNLNAILSTLDILYCNLLSVSWLIIHFVLVTTSSILQVYPSNLSHYIEYVMYARFKTNESVENIWPEFNM